jgi:hypothetical protein
VDAIARVELALRRRASRRAIAASLCIVKRPARGVEIALGGSSLAVRNRVAGRRLTGMEQIKAKLTAEIKQFKADIDAQKRVIKHSITKGLAIEDAERNLKGLRTRLDVLETNLKKYDPEPEGEIA